MANSNERDIASVNTEKSVTLVTPFKCVSCNLIFPYEEEWSVHMKNVHKAYPQSCCRRCGAHSFKTISDLKSHLKTVHSETGVRRRVQSRKGPTFELNEAELCAMEKIPQWLVKLGQGKIVVAVHRDASVDT